MLIRLLLVCIGLCLPAHAAGQSAGAGNSGGTGEAIALPNTEAHRVSSADGRTYHLYVTLPESYAKSDAATYPVIYLTDAELEIMAMYAGIAYFLRLTNRIRDVILVGVADGAVAVHGTLRRLDYTPTQLPPDSTSGGADTFLNFLGDVAIPFVEDRYRADPGDRGLLGYSFGGLLGAHALLNRPGMFHRYLLTSPSVHWDDRLLVSQAAAYGATHGDLPALVYTVFGAEETASSMAAWRAFIGEIEGRRYPNLSLTSEVIPSADHTTVMPVAFLRGMAVLYGPDARPPR